MCSSLVAMECSLSMRLGSQRPMSGGGPQSSYNLGELTPFLGVLGRAASWIWGNWNNKCGEIIRILRRIPGKSRWAIRHASFFPYFARHGIVYYPHKSSLFGLVSKIGLVKALFLRGLSWVKFWMLLTVLIIWGVFNPQRTLNLTQVWWIEN